MRPGQRQLGSTYQPLFGELGLPERHAEHLLDRLDDALPDLTPSVAHRHAATGIIAQFSITFNPPPGPGVFNLKAFVKVPMSAEDAHGYLNNGARIELRFYGDDPGSDPLLLGPITFVKSATGLSAGPEGIRLLHRSQEAGGSWLNEDDSWGNRGDEVYVNARFIDGDGAVIQTNSNVQTGFF